MWSAGRIPTDGRAQLIALSAEGAEKLARHRGPAHGDPRRTCLQDWSQDDAELTRASTLEETR